MRRLLVVIVLLVVVPVVVPLAGAPPKKTPARALLAPAELPHPIAMFLAGLSHEGARSVTFKASAAGTRFFFEESAGVTVYVFRNGGYVKETFLANSTLAKATKRYGVR